MGEQVTKAVTNIKEFWGSQSKTKKTIFASGLAAILLMAIVITVVVNLQAKPAYEVVATGASADETSQIVALLQEQAIDVTVDSKGNVTIPPEHADEVRLKLASMGLPKTALSYDTFTSNSGFTTTEMEKKQFLLFQLQDRLQSTIGRIENVKNSAVTLNIAAETAYVWNEDTSVNTASVMLDLVPGTVLKPEQVSAIQTLVATSVPKMLSQSVAVFDSATGLQLISGESTSDSSFDFSRLGFEQEVEKRLEEKVMKLLSMPYGAENVRVAATVVLDYDKMIMEELQYNPGADGKGIPTHEDLSYAMDPTKVTGDVVGETNNTDVPVYVDKEEDGTLDYVDYDRSIDYLVGYIKTQVQKDNAKLKEASFSVVVNDPNLTQQKKDSMIATISAATNIPNNKIEVNSFNTGEEVEPLPDTTANAVAEPIPWMIIIPIGILALIVILVLIIFMILGARKRKKLKLAAEAAVAEAAAQAALLGESQDVEKEIELHKLKLKNAAGAGSKEEAIKEEVKSFAAQNPEITASLLRAWLKEDES